MILTLIKYFYHYKLRNFDKFIFIYYILQMLVPMRAQRL